MHQLSRSAAHTVSRSVAPAPELTSHQRASVRTRAAVQQPGTMSGTAAPAAGADRAKAAIAGALVADAATMPLHWIYDQAKIQALLKGADRVGRPEFFEPPSCPFYEMPGGSLSPYGAELAAMLTYLAAPAQQQQVAAKAPLDGASWSQALAAYFGSVYKGYQNHSIKTVIANVAAGKVYPETGDAQDTQANSLCKLPAVTAVYAGSEQLAAAVEASVRAQQNNDTSVSLALAAAKILEKVVLGASIDEALQWAQARGNLTAPVAALIKDALALKGQPFSAAATKLGVSCSQPGAFQGAVLAAATAGSYEDGVRANLQAGGDNCSRGVYMGALLGAAYGVPAEWKAKVTGWTEFERDIDRIVQQ